MEMRILSSYGDLSESYHKKVELQRFSLEMYHRLWRNRVKKLVDEKLVLEGNPVGLRSWLLYSIYGLSDFEFTRGFRYLHWLEFQTNQYVKHYRRLKAEVHLLKLQHDLRAIQGINDV